MGTASLPIFTAGNFGQNDLPTNLGAGLGTSLSGLLSNPLLLTGLGGLAGAFPTPTTTSGSSSTSTSGTNNTFGTANTQSLQDLLNKLTGSTSATTTTGYGSPAATGLSDQLTKQFSALAASPTNLQPYQQQQEANINRNSQTLDKSQQEELAARGLSTSPVAASVAANTDASRVGQITQLQQSIPLLQQQLLQQNLNSAGGFLANAPKTSTTAGTQEQTSTGSQTGNTSQTSNGNSNQTGAQNTNSTSTQNSGGGIGGLFGGLGSMLAALFH